MRETRGALALWRMGLGIELSGAEDIEVFEVQGVLLNLDEFVTRE